MLGQSVILRKTHKISLYAFFWVILRRLNFICRRFGTLCLFHLHRQVGMKKFRSRGIIHKRNYNVQNTAKVLNKKRKHSLHLLACPPSFEPGTFYRESSNATHNTSVRESIWYALCSKSSILYNVYRVFPGCK